MYTGLHKKKLRAEVQPLTIFDSHRPMSWLLHHRIYSQIANVLRRRPSSTRCRAALSLPCAPFYSCVCLRAASISQNPSYSHQTVCTVPSSYNVFQKKYRHTNNNLNSSCPVPVIFGTDITEWICHRKVVQFPTFFVYIPYLGNFKTTKIITYLYLHTSTFSFCLTIFNLCRYSYHFINQCCTEQINALWIWFTKTHYD